MITDVYQTAYIYISSSSKTSTALWAKGPRGTKSPIKPWSVHVIGLRIIGHNKGVYVPAHSAGSEGSLNFLLEITDRLRLAQTALRIRRLIWNQLMSEGEKKFLKKYQWYLFICSDLISSVWWSEEAWEISAKTIVHPCECALACVLNHRHSPTAESDSAFGLPLMAFSRMFCPPLMTSSRQKEDGSIMHLYLQVPGALCHGYGRLG